MDRLLGKTALVTGAASGIGAAIARAFVAEGALVWVTDLRDEPGIAVARSLGAAARYAHLDLREESEWISVIAGILHEHSHLDVVVNNAGVTGFEGEVVPHDPENASLEAWRTVMRTNVDGTFLGCKHAIRAMRKQGEGSIINISSRSGLVGVPVIAAYAASKAAIRNHTKSVALYCAGQGLRIRCNSIHPATILTPMWDPMLGSGEEREERMEMMIQGSPLRRFGTAEEVARVAVMLASDEVPYMTGAELTVDGGLLAGSAANPKRK